MFVWNVWRSYRHGEEAGPNPWGADTLEWATPSPPAEHGWSLHPIIRSRHPLWEQDDLHSGSPATERFVEGLGAWPLRWRAAIIVSTADGRPQEVFRVANPSIWPLIAGGGVVLIFLSELIKLRWGAALGALVIVAAAIAWNWPQPAPMTEEEEDDFEREHDVAVNAGGSVVVAAWGMGLAILFVTIAFSAFLLSYFYLRLENPTWPPSGIPDPALTPPLLALALLVPSGIAAWFALRRVRADDQRGFIGSLLLALVLAGAAVGVQGAELVRTPFGATDHSFGAIHLTLGSFLIGVALVAMIMVAMTVFWAFRGLYTARRHAAVANIVRFWTAMIVIWVVGFATLTLGPRLT